MTFCMKEEENSDRTSFFCMRLGEFCAKWKFNKNCHRPGFELGSLAWEAVTLTAILQDASDKTKV